MAHLSGELIHIVKCVAVEVEIRDDLDTCYNQIPVIYKGNEMFLSHKTKILVNHGSERKCSKILPVGFQTSAGWIIFSPKLTFIKEPDMLSPDLKITWNPKDMGNLAKAGIYGEQEMKEYMNQILFPIVKTTILENTAATISRVEEISSPSNEIYSIFEYGYWQSLALRYWKSFQKFGVISSGLFMILIIFYVIKEIINIIIRGLTLHKIFGFSTKLLAAILSSLTHFVLILGKAEEKEVNENNIEMKSQEIRPINPKQRSKLPIPIRNSLKTLSSKYPSSSDLSQSSINDENLSDIIPKPNPRKSLHSIIQVENPSNSAAQIHENAQKIKEPRFYNHLSC